MLKNISITIVSAMVAIACFGCAQFNMAETDSQLDKNWGRSFETAKYNQTLHPDADQNLKPVEGISGPAAEKVVIGTMVSGCTQKANE